MEALGIGMPVVSPMLIHIPDLDVVDDVGVVTPHLRSVEDAVKFASQLLYIMENLSTFKPAVALKSLRSPIPRNAFVNNFNDTLENMTNH